MEFVPLIDDVLDFDHPFTKFNEICRLRDRVERLGKDWHVLIEDRPSVYVSCLPEGVVFQMHELNSSAIFPQNTYWIHVSSKHPIGVQLDADQARIGVRNDEVKHSTFANACSS